MVGRLVIELRAIYWTALFVSNVLPTLPTLSPTRRNPVVRRLISLPESCQAGEAELYLPRSSAPFPGVVVCLGVVPAGVEHPQVARLGNALARSGLAALLYWSPAMRDLRLDPADINGIATAYRWLIDQPQIDPDRSGLIGTCVGGAFALMAAAHPAIRDRVAFVGAFAPFASMWTLAIEIVSRMRPVAAGQERWDVDPLTWRVFVHTLTECLDPADAELLRSAYDASSGHIDASTLSEKARAVQRVLEPLDLHLAETALRDLPVELLKQLDRMSPVRYLHEIHAPCIVLAHDRDDPVIPIGQLRRLAESFGDRSGLRYTEFTMFKHLDPTKVKLGRLGLARELTRFIRTLHPIIRSASGIADPSANGRGIGAPCG
jgi:hypothetical protein